MPPFYVAVVGAGPAGFFSAASLLKIEHPAVHVDMFERLPTPWGLVRSGVAPDHPKIKAVSAVFAKTALHDRFRFFGNVELGRDMSREQLLERYDAVVYATGAQRDRALGVPGEDLPGSVAATELVGWYNGHPDFTTLPVDLSVRAAIVIGNGNVALDVARILTTQPSELCSTDIADHALQALTASAIDEVTVVGRRGPLQAAFTTSELRELGALDGVYVDVDPADLADITDDELAAVGPVEQRNIEVLRDLAVRPRPSGRHRRITLRFGRSPVELRGGGRVREIVLAHNDLRVDGAGVVAVDSGQREHLDCGLVVRAIGYRGAAIEGVPFDRDRGIVLHVDGRVTGGDREYVVGWAKRGPSGIIGTNKKCAQQTVDVIVGDLASGALAPLRGRLEPPNMAETGEHPGVVLAEGWLAIDRMEVASGRAAGRPRVKLCTRDELLAAAHSAT
ncbi:MULTISPECIES: FAD-dependent oxidoreductase [Pseudonocardia]|uniref:ferredoxin--NADP(+) reductase n=2 Tax=Pseudonocardia TaxID=1847 RepID=A0A1Y2MHK7_PSEAH|nr:MULTISPECIES: FAD-dependent oxidoreductase [Pseudonocardia]OSY34765.1 NADPH-ferredoxin reductase FprA [Pseudonocardia autotrophica]TDN76093.1 ferredoxin--NADP+ reductase [Pseudonocardia autotrophica]BBG00072.1 NADPH-ferredoxin reductase FprA [Pseudonocardia autotrophica]GEC26037.1 NADPH-ferredoxin reductase FprA [Pseudonocardia saturnea]